MIDIPPQISFVFFFVWLLLFLAGRFQMNRIKKATVSMVETEIIEAHLRNPKISVNEFYHLIFPKWKDQVSSKYWFILHKSELFPIRASTENIVQRINFTPEWLGAFLELKGYRLKRTRQQEEKIKEILSLTSKK